MDTESYFIQLTSANFIELISVDSLNTSSSFVSNRHESKDAPRYADLSQHVVSFIRTSSPYVAETTLQGGSVLAEN